jgi:hypothetical protein
MQGRKRQQLQQSVPPKTVRSEARLASFRLNA